VSESLVESSVACAQIYIYIYKYLRISMLFGLAHQWFSSVLDICFDI